MFKTVKRRFPAFLLLTPWKLLKCFDFIPKSILPDTLLYKSMFKESSERTDIWPNILIYSNLKHFYVYVFTLIDFAEKNKFKVFFKHSGQLMAWAQCVLFTTPFLTCIFWWEHQTPTCSFSSSPQARNRLKSSCKTSWLY